MSKIPQMTDCCLAYRIFIFVKGQNHLIMNISTHLTTLLLCICMCSMACGGSTSTAEATETNTPETDGSNTDLNSAINSANSSVERSLEQLGQLQDQNNERPILSQEALGAMVPGSLVGMPQVEESLETTQVAMGGVEMSTARATFKDPDDPGKRLDLIISDGMSAQTMGMGMGVVPDMDLREGNKRTYTTEINGHRAVVEFDGDDGTGQIAVMHNQSTVVLEGRGLSGDEELKTAYRQLDLAGL